ncbi:exodeoxyribonuclease V subunit beta [Solidesulfovibrio carbinolicus]|nr:exodeoxyribonuclease V subunit beta [Solidesulfovibrio carbinolicus]
MLSRCDPPAAKGISENRLRGLRPSPQPTGENRMTSPGPVRKPLDLGSVPLSGCRTVVEASAGTGKTYALAALFLRLVLEQGLGVDEVLVVTFTEAATAELKTRIRARLMEALAACDPKAAPPGDPFLTQLLGSVGHRLAGERASKALLDFDLAAIHTIHAFCKRILTDCAFECGGLFRFTMLTDETLCHRQAVQDFYRAHVQEGEAVVAARLAGTFTEKLHGLLDKGIRNPRLRILPDDLPENCTDRDCFSRDLEVMLFKAGDAWKDLREEFCSCLDNRTMLKNHLREEDLPGMKEALDRFFENGTSPLFLPADIDRLCASSLVANLKKKAPPPAHPFFTHLENLLSHLDLRRVALLRAFGLGFGNALRRYKAERRQLGFSDLLNETHAALHGPGGRLLRDRVRAGLKAALIDEFQDTDLLQYEIFHTLFAEPPHALYCIGDPKQAIYAFRGADVFAYLEAIHNADQILTQNVNWRSDPGMLAAVKAIFGAKEPFVFREIAFEPVSPRPGAKQRLTVADEGPACLRVWHIRSEDIGDEPGGNVAKGKAEQPVALAVAEEIVRLLILSSQGKATITDATSGQKRPLAASDFAVLVKSHKEAGIIREALAARGIPSVRQQTDKIFESVEADELAIVLRAVAAYDREGLRRAALSTAILGWTAADLDRLDIDDALREELLEQFAEYHSIWAGQGVMAFVAVLFSRGKVRERLLGLPDGERRMTNLLQCVELLHQREIETGLGVLDLAAWLEAIRSGSNDAEDEAGEMLIRLETDAPAVRIMTVHKSKGLEFEIVFLPYVAWSDPKEIDRSVYHDPMKGHIPTLDLSKELPEPTRARIEQELEAERMRLFYVALTRAKCRCYLAWGAFGSVKRTPLGRLVHEGKIPTAETVDRALKDLASNCPSIEIAPLPRPSDTRLPADNPDPVTLEARQFTRHLDPSFGTTSFTALSRNASDASRLPLFERDETNTPTVATLATARRDRLPAGAVPGIMFHTFFERLDFQAAASSDPDARLGIERWAAHCLIRHGLSRDLSGELADLAQRVVLAPLPDGFTLADVVRDHTAAEMEFLLPLDRLDGPTLARIYAQWANSFPYDWSPWAAKLRPSVRQGFLTGSMDLVFCHGGRYYLLDWKSNRLPPQDHAPERLPVVMAENRYFLQYHLYCLALDRHLRATCPGYDYDLHFGGVLYIFLRGASPDAVGQGIFHDRPAQGFLMDLEQAILTPHAREATHASH